MWNAKLDIYDHSWLEAIFLNRNRAYGAYQLRKEASAATIKALLIVAFSVFASVGLHYVIEKFVVKPDLPTQRSLENTTVDLLALAEEPEELLEAIPKESAPQQIAQDPPAIDLIRFPEPTLVDHRLVKEEMATQAELKGDKMPARISLRKVDGGSIVVKGEFGPVKKEGEITGKDVGDSAGGETGVFVAVEVMPEPIDGMTAFVQWVAAQYVYPEAAVNQEVNGVVQVSFVVEKDGSLSDIRVLRDLGFGTGQEAIRVLKTAKKWHAGIQNGRPVRVSYTLPIKLNLEKQ